MQAQVAEQRPLVSVVIATYNMGKYVGDAVRSVLAQTYSPIEVIVIDDGSTDDTNERLKEFEREPLVRWVRTENQGQPKAKNAGLSLCRGEFIAFCDADDLYEPNKVELQVPEFARDGRIGVVYTDVSTMNQDGGDLTRFHVAESDHWSEGRVTEQLIVRNFVPFGTAMISRECLDKIGMFDESLPMGIDWDLWLRCSLHFEFRHIPVSTYRYREWPGQMSKNHRGRYANAEIIMKKFFALNPGIVPRHLERRAWSDTYANKSVHLALQEGAYFEALNSALRGVMTDCLYPRAWWALAKTAQLAVAGNLRARQR